MKTRMLTRVRRLHPYHDLADPRIVRHNRRQWVRSIRQLGNNWILATFVQRSENPS